MEFSEEEKKLLKQYQNLPASMTNLVKRLAVEIIPPVIFIFLGLYTGRIVWFIVLIILMVFYNVQRIVRQHNNIKKLNSISLKAIGDHADETKT